MLKNVKAEQRFEAARLEMTRVFQRYGDDLRPDEQLAIAAYFVGQLIALQDASKFNHETIMALVGSNIELGNLAVVEANKAGRL